MKKIFYMAIVALAAFAAASCNKNASPVDVPGVEQNEPTGNIKIVLNTSDEPSTKALSSAAAEDKINTVQVFIFNKATGKCEKSQYEQITGNVTGTHTINLTSLTGLKEVWAIVNSPRVTNVPDLNALKQKVSDLSDNTITGLTMTGFNDNVDVKETNANVASQQNVVTNAPIDVYRLGARISLQNVTVDFTNTDLQGTTFAVTGLYMKNVVGKIRLDGASTGAGIDLGQVASWYNMCNQTNVLNAPAAIQALTKDMPLSVNCNSAGTATTMGYSWYVYPNATTLDQDTYADGISVPRRTRLVIKAHLSGTSVGGAVDRDTYYVFSIPEIKRNYAYNITNLKITAEGKPDDNTAEPTNSGKMEVTITVKGWEHEETLTYEI